MKIFCFIFLFAFLTSCQNTQDHPYTFYFWRTHLSLISAEKVALQKATAPYLYTRFFDIEKRADKFQPVAVITKDQTFKTDKEIVPVIFIKNEVFYNITSAELDFVARNVYDLIKKKQHELGFKDCREIQIDCDWTTGTQKEYFAFLKRLQNYSRKNITCTLRLHQVKQRELSGMPPVKKVYLMCYSTSSPLENSGRNSILDVSTLKNYLNNVESYPIKMDVALPIYSWGIITNHMGKHKLINGLSTDDLDNSNFKKHSLTEAEIMKDGFYFGNYLSKGFTIKVEGISDEQLNEVKSFLDTKIPNYNIIYYHLDRKFTENYEF